MAKISEAMLYKKLGELGHAHFCSDRDCRAVYDCLRVRFTFDCDPRVNGLCPACRGRETTAWTRVRQPQPCCANNVVQVTDRDVLLAYRLAGPGPWFRCKTCARCHAWPRGASYETTNKGETR